MKNVEKITELAPVFQASTRPFRNVEDLSSLKDAGVNFEAYTIRMGETLTFPKFEDVTVIAQPVRKGSDTEIFLVACVREKNGKKTPSWFNLNSLTKRDADNNPVYQDWYDLGNVEARLQALCAAGGIKAVGEQTIKVPAFKNGDRVYSEVIGADGVPVQIGAVKEQKVIMFEKC